MVSRRRPAPSTFHRAGWNRGDHGHPPFGVDDLPATIPGELTAAGDFVPHASRADLDTLAADWDRHPRTQLARLVFGSTLELELGLRAGYAAVDRFALVNDLNAAHPLGACRCEEPEPELEAVA